MEQITINYDAPLTQAWSTCREYVASRVHLQGIPQKAIAADMDYSPSDLTRKLAQSPNDSRRFTLDDLERFMAVTGDTSPIAYLAEKFLKDVDRISELEAELARLKSVRGVV